MDSLIRLQLKKYFAQRRFVNKG